MNLKDPGLFRTQAYVDGAWVDADDGTTRPVSDPATGLVIAEVANCAKAETKRAIEAAERAQVEWRRVPAKEKSRLIRNLFDLMMTHQEDLGTIMTLEQGKPLAEAQGEIAYGAAFLEWFAEEAKRVYGDTIPGPTGDRRIVVVKEPVGVVACIAAVSSRTWGGPRRCRCRC